MRTSSPKQWMLRATRIPAVLLLGLALVGVTPQPAHAACAVPVDQVAAMTQADSVFVGRVVDLDDFSRSATMQVIEVWKGPDLLAQVTVNGSFSGSPQIGPSDRTYVLGASYLVVPFGSRSPFFDEACSGTVLYAPAGGLIPAQYRDAVGTSTARGAAEPSAASSEAVDGGGVNWTLVGGAGGAVLVLLALMLRRRSRGRRGRAQAPARSAPTSSLPPADRRDRDRPTDAAAAVAGVVGRKKLGRRKKRRSRLRRGPRSRRYHRSGLDDLESIRKKTRRVKKKTRKKRKVRS